MKAFNGFNDYCTFAGSLRTSANLRKIELIAKGWEDKYGKLGKKAFSCFPFDMRSVYTMSISNFRCIWYVSTFRCHLDLQFIHGRPPDTSYTSGQELYNQIHSLELVNVKFSSWAWQRTLAPEAQEDEPPALHLGNPVTWLLVILAGEELRNTQKPKSQFSVWYWLYSAPLIHLKMPEIWRGLEVS